MSEELEHHEMIAKAIADLANEHKMKGTTVLAGMCQVIYSTSVEISKQEGGQPMDYVKIALKDMYKIFEAIEKDHKKNISNDCLAEEMVKSILNL